jgi:hypothetical protein
VAGVARLGTVSEHARGRAVSGVQDQHFRVYGVGGMGVREAWMVLTDLPPCEASVVRLVS